MLLAGCERSQSDPSALAAELPPETTTIRLGQTLSTCRAPEYLATELLYAEGFTEVPRLKGNAVDVGKALAAGAIDLSLDFAATLATRVEAGEPIVGLGGVHVGCAELFGSERVRTIRDLKGKTVAVEALGVGTISNVLLVSMAAYVGLDPRKDINWLVLPADEYVRLFAQDKVDAIMAFPPLSQDLRAKRIGHVVVNSAVDKPWSHYYCCIATGNREFVRRHPVATKRALRAMLKATDLCAREPERVARYLVEQGYTADFNYALQGLQELPYDKWREYDPEDSLRFYALRLQEAGMLKNSPKKIISQGTDWRFFNELKKELKG